MASMKLTDSRISYSEGVELFEKSNLLEIGEIADGIRKQIHGEGIVTFVIDRNINYTNICSCKCKFCGFYRDDSDEDAYVITDEELFNKIEETITLGGTQILIQGGLNPDLDITYYENMLKKIKSKYDIWIHGFSPPEIDFMSRTSGISLDETIERLVKAGLDSIPGGGAELLVDTERFKISPNKINSDGWLNVMRNAHHFGLKTTATMMFKKSDSIEYIIEHLDKIRELQDETGGFTAFIPWPFQPDNTELGGEGVTAVEYLKILSLCRIYLDNIRNIQVSWVTQGPKIGQMGLYFGGNDFGSLMIEENVVAACGASYKMSVGEILHNIKSAGFIPAQRDMKYNIIRRFD